MALGTGFGLGSSPFLDDLTINLPGGASTKGTTTQKIEAGGTGTLVAEPLSPPFPWFALIMVLLALAIAFVIIYFKLWRLVA